jgi:hypothetical protein
VAFSVPIWSRGPTRKVVGVLSMTVELGRFGELHPSSSSSDRQIAVLVDGREDWTGHKGLVLQHPHLSELLKQRLPLPPYRMDERHIRTIDELRQAVSIGQSLPTGLLYDAHYRDPVRGDYGGEWLMTMRPVLARGSDTGWVVLVQERVTDITAPVASLGRSLLRIGVIGLALMALMWLLLWWSVRRTWIRS